MCVELPVELVELGPDGAAVGTAGGREVRVSLLVLDEPVAAGDWVLAHAGFALHRITCAEAHTVLAAREEQP